MRWLVGLTLVQAVLCSVLGVDFGAEFTKSALVAPNIPFEIILTQDSKRKDTSGLLFKPVDGEFERVYGTTGHALVSRFPQAAFYYLKQLLGLPVGHEGVSSYQDLNPGVVLSGSTRQSIDLSIASEQIPVEEAVAMTFSDIKRRAQELLDHKFGTGSIKDVAVAIPGHLTMDQRRALVDAIELSGLSLISLVDDGVAVAVNYASTRQFTEDKQYIAVYDMGAQSTTSTLLSVRQEGNNVVIDVEGFGYDTNLGGHAITKVIRDTLVDELSKVAKVSTVDLRTPKILNRLWREAERAKAVLSANTETRVHIESAYKDYNIDLKIERAVLEKACQGLVSRVSGPLQDSFKLFNGDQLQVADLDSVILAGGGTRSPFVQAEIRKMAGDIISKNVNADEAACMGATLRGVGISGIFKSKNITVVDRSPFDYSLTVNGDKKSLFPTGSTLSSTARLNVSVTDELKLELIENGSPILQWSIPSISEAITYLEESSKCVDEPTVDLKFQLDKNRIAQLMWSSVKCNKAITKTNETTTENVETRESSRYLPATPKYMGATPLSSSERQKLLYHMSVLDKADKDRQRKEGLHHELETLLYRLRDLAPELPDIHSLMEWIDEGKGTIVQYAEKLAHAKKIHKDLKPEADPKPESEQKSEPEQQAQKPELDLAKLLTQAGIVVDKTQENWLLQAFTSATAEQIENLKKQLPSLPKDLAEKLLEVIDKLSPHDEL
ncbi:Heat shock protein 70 LHS1 [Wickerhamiella sorbophila]|uniref:Heat shock protein 70 LHS1 n=1 Tax=Wickerhamiella sorbophila TaxID=45607 RepID=A0A2T0FNG6_9ASCO|nr:Heat shock protein 70 LHS1 [Wickerhamiella sorbophila]PRT56515.1 Heat shock protein 70 LHS1 [Wickerhamiella sorbophila]